MQVRSAQVSERPRRNGIVPTVLGNFFVTNVKCEVVAGSPKGTIQVICKSCQIPGALRLLRGGD